MKYDEQLPMIAVRQQGIINIVKAGIDLTGPSLRAFLSSQEYLSTFNYGGEAIREYLDASLVPSRGNA